MNIIIGLGNPGKKYLHTRHNIGHIVVDQLQELWGFPPFSFHKKFDAEISEGMQNGNKIILAKPQTFMNLSGISVRKLLDFYKLTESDLFIIQDELDLAFGKYKLATNSSSAGHNGIKNIIEHLHTQEFTRLRIGIATEKQDGTCLQHAHEFVLDEFTPEEATVLDDSFPAYAAVIEATLNQRINA